jgi:hypothetical protein
MVFALYQVQLLTSRRNERNFLGLGVGLPGSRHRRNLGRRTGTLSSSQKQTAQISNVPGGSSVCVLNADNKDKDTSQLLLLLEIRFAIYWLEHSFWSALAALTANVFVALSYINTSPLVLLATPTRDCSLRMLTRRSRSSGCTGHTQNAGLVPCCLASALDLVFNDIAIIMTGLIILILKAEPVGRIGEPQSERFFSFGCRPTKQPYHGESVLASSVELPD